MATTTTYKFAGRTQKLLKSLLENGGTYYCNITVTTNYLRNKDDVNDLQSAIKIVDNLCDYDPDFDEEPIHDYKCSIPQSAIKNYYTDLICKHNLYVVRLPNDIIDFPNDTFLTIGEYQIEDVIHHSKKKLNTIKFADNNEMLGDVNTDIVDSVKNMDKLISSFYQFGRIKPIETIESDGYLAFKYANDIDENSFKL